MDIPEWFNNDTLRATYLYTEGVRVVALEDDPAKAFSYFEKVLEIDSLHAPTHHTIADILLQSDPAKALRHSEVAYCADSTNLDYASLYGYALAHNNELTRARTVYEAIVAEDPNPSSYRFLARLYASSGMPHMAVTVLDSAEYKLGKVEELSRYKLELLVALKLYDRAIEEVSSMVANNPRNGGNYTMLAILYDNIKKDSLAEANYKKALEINPEETSTLFYLANFYKSRGFDEPFLGVVRTLFLSDELSIRDKVEMFDSSVIDNEEFYRKNFYTINSLISILNVKYPRVYEVSWRYADHLIRAGELERALEIYKEFAVDPTEPRDALHRVIDIEDYFGRRDSVMHYLDIAINRNPSDEDFYFRKGYELLKVGREKEAKSLFRKVVKFADSDEIRSVAYATLGDSESNPKRSAKYYRKALEYNPQNARALNNWAYYMCEGGGDLEEALELSMAACELEPKNATYLDTKAWILFKLGRFSEAKKIMRQAISLDTSGDSTLLLHYGDILAAEGEVFMAELYYKRALEAGEEPAVIEERVEALKK